MVADGRNLGMMEEESVGTVGKVFHIKARNMKKERLSGTYSREIKSITPGQLSVGIRRTKCVQKAVSHQH